MDGGDREVFERSLRHAVETHSGEPLDAALLQIGWRDALAEHPQEAVSILFELEGAAHASSSALEQVLACSLGLDVPPAAGLVLPRSGAGARPASSTARSWSSAASAPSPSSPARRPWWWRRR